MEKDIMKFEPVLPANFDGNFYFSNWSKEDFIGVWNSKQYLFPAQRMTKMVIADHSPLEIQHIRKKFAKDLAEREFFKSKNYNTLQSQEGKSGNRTMSGIHQAGQYTLDDLAPFIKKGLEPMEAADMLTRPVDKVEMEDKLRRNDDGSLISEAIDQKKSLVQKALNS